MNDCKLKQLLTNYKNAGAIELVLTQFERINNSTINSDKIKLYQTCIPIIEKIMWQGQFDSDLLDIYQQCFIELENLIPDITALDNRHEFIIAIPVADRPQHLKSCLHSIYTLCETYNYGGSQNGKYRKIKVLISDDSKHPSNKSENINLTEVFSNKGLEVIYFGQDEQKEILHSIDYQKTQNITGLAEPENFYHKGASITRNITYLKLQQLRDNNKSTLFYFIDSDQEFKINTLINGENREFYAINYFYHLDRIFSQEEISILTGKVVGDPPVSPSVMAGTFLEDLLYFIKKSSRLKPVEACGFHNDIKSSDDDASYHDMAELFGFKDSKNDHDYHCTLSDPHNNADCFSDFSSKLKHFFDGEHPTRKTYYQHDDILNTIKPARTIYTGNYIFKPECLKYFIPFANLKLRMAGPVLGRLLKSELGEKFVSANLPMLHKRTVNTIGQSEFRPGVDHHDETIDLSGEFTRQFFGDVMLFSMIELTNQGFPEKSLSATIINKTIRKTITSMQSKYFSKRDEILRKKETLLKLLDDSVNWWSSTAGLSTAVLNFKTFIDNINFNFGDNASIYTIINTEDVIIKHQQIITDAILAYKNDMDSWQNILANNRNQI